MPYIHIVIHSIVSGFNKIHNWMLIFHFIIANKFAASQIGVVLMQTRDLVSYTETNSWCVNRYQFLTLQLQNHFFSFFFLLQFVALSRKINSLIFNCSNGSSAFKHVLHSPLKFWFYFLFDTTCHFLQSCVKFISVRTKKKAFIHSKESKRKKNRLLKHQTIYTNYFLLLAGIYSNVL